MKKNDWIIFAVITLSALVLFLFTGHQALSYSDPYLEIQVDGKLYGSYPLSEDRTIHIRDTNVCVIEGGKVRMTEADCPDQVCVHTKPIPGNGDIICLPNRVILKIVNGEEGGPDAVAE